LIEYTVLVLILHLVNHVNIFLNYIISATFDIANTSNLNMRIFWL